MKLKQKFESWFLKEVRFTMSKTHIADRFEEIADNHAIGFAFWLLTEKDETKTLREMLEKFKKEKGL